MLDRRTKRQIEWAFRNYNANKALGAAQVAEIAESGITVDFERITCGGSTGSPTESKALKLCERAKQYLWAKVVENTMTAFEFEIQGEMIKDCFNPFGINKNKLKFSQLIEKYGGANANKSVYIYRYNKIMELALAWAERYEIF